MTLNDSSWNVTTPPWTGAEQDPPRIWPVGASAVRLFLIQILVLFAPTPNWLSFVLFCTLLSSFRFTGNQPRLLAFPLPCAVCQSVRPEVVSVAPANGVFVSHDVPQRLTRTRVPLPVPIAELEPARPLVKSRNSRFRLADDRYTDRPVCGPSHPEPVQRRQILDRQRCIGFTHGAAFQAMRLARTGWTRTDVRVILRFPSVAQDNPMTRRHSRSAPGRRPEMESLEHRIVLSRISSTAHLHSRGAEFAAQTIKTAATKTTLAVAPARSVSRSHST